MATKTPTQSINEAIGATEQALAALKRARTLAPSTGALLAEADTSLRRALRSIDAATDGELATDVEAVYRR